MPNGERDFLRDVAKQVTRDEEKLRQLRGEDLEERFKRLRRGETPPAEPEPSYSFIEGMEARPKPEPSFAKLMRRDPLESPLWGTFGKWTGYLRDYYEKPFAAALLTRIYEPEKYEAIIKQKRGELAGELGIDLAQRESQVEEMAKKVYIDPSIMRMWSETPFGEMEATVPFYAAEELKPGGELMKLYEEGDYPKYVRGATELGVSLPFYLLAWQGFAATPAGAAVNSGLNKSFQWLFKYPIAKYVKWKTGFTPAEIKWHQEVFTAYEKGVEAGAWQGIFKTNTVRNEVMKNTAKMYETSPDAALAYFNAFAKTDPQFVAVLSNYMDRVSILKLPGAVEASAGIKIFEQNMGLTPAPVAGGLAGRLPALPITAEKWAIMSMPDKVNLVQSLGLSGKIASKAWEALTGAEKAILTVKPAVPEAVPEAGVIPAGYKINEVAGVYDIYRPDGELIGTRPTEAAAIKYVQGYEAEFKLAIPKPEVGMPEPGLQAGALGVPSKIVTPLGRGEITQIGMDDYAKLVEAQMKELGIPEAYQFNVAKIDQRLAEINKLLAVTGKLPAGKGTRAELSIEQATLETQRDIVGMIGEVGTNREGLLGFIDTAIGEVSNEIGLRKMPYHGGVSENLFPDKTVPQLDEMMGVYQNFRVALTRMERPLAPPPPPAKAPKTLTAQLKDLYSDISTEVKASQAAIRGMTGDEARMARISLAEMERSLKNINKALTAFEKEPRLPDATKLKQLIHIWAKHKGFTQAQLETIYKRVTGTPKIRAGRQVMVGKQKLTNMTTPELQKVLAEVRRARPTRIGNKVVIKADTERQIQSLKDTLISEKRLSEGAFDDIMKQLKITTPSYVSQYRFITESQGKELIRTMNTEAEVGYITRRIAEEEGLAREGNENLATLVKEYEARLGKEYQAYLKGDKPVEVKPWLWNMSRYTQFLQGQTGKPFYHIWDMAYRQYRANEIIETDYAKRLLQSTPEFKAIRGDKKALDRINNYIAAKNKWMDVPKSSYKGITEDEKRIAHTCEDFFMELQNDYRYRRFTFFYNKYQGNVDKIVEEIPNASKESINIAVNTYESRGALALKNYLDTQTWGIIGSGFEPHQVVNPRLGARGQRIMFPKGLFQARTGIQFHPAERDIISRTMRYVKQMESGNLEPYVMKLEAIFEEARSQLKNPGQVSRALTASINEMRGYTEGGEHPLYRLIIRLASQAYTTIFGTLPVLPFRNLFQNWAWMTDRSIVFDPRNKRLSKLQLQLYELFGSEMKGISRGMMLADEPGFPGLGRVNRMVHRANIYGISDSKINRIIPMYGYVNKVDRALVGYATDKDVEKFVKNSGMGELTLQNQVDILRMLARDEVEYPYVGSIPKEEAVKFEIAHGVTKNIHFEYHRAARAFWEMGAFGRVFGSLVTFPRQVLERAALQIKVLLPGSYATAIQKKRAFKVLFNLIVGGMVAGAVFQKVTNRQRNPYNPLNILSWTPGGLALGSVVAVADVFNDILSYIGSAGEDKAALHRLPEDLNRAGDTFIPFYKLTRNTLEALIGLQYIDRLAVREIIAVLDQTYEPNREFYEKERDTKAKITHAIFGTEEPELPPIEKATGELAKLEKQLGKLIEDEDNESPYIYTTQDLAIEINSLTRDINFVDITEENGFSPLVVMYKQAEWYWDNYYYSLPASQRGEFRDNPHDICAWTEAYLFIWGKLTVLRNPKGPGAVQQLISQYNIPDKAVPALETQRGRGLPAAPSDLEERFKRLRGGGQGQSIAPVEESLEERFARLRRGE